MALPRVESAGIQFPTDLLRHAATMLFGLSKVIYSYNTVTGQVKPRGKREQGNEFRDATVE